MRYHFTPVRIAIITNSTKNLERVDTVSANVTWCSHYGKQCGGFSEN